MVLRGRWWELAQRIHPVRPAGDLRAGRVVDVAGKPAGPGQTDRWGSRVFKTGCRARVRLYPAAAGRTRQARGRRWPAHRSVSGRSIPQPAAAVAVMGRSRSKFSPGRGTYGGERASHARSAHEQEVSC